VDVNRAPRTDERGGVWVGFITSVVSQYVQNGKVDWSDAFVDGIAAWATMCVGPYGAPAVSAGAKCAVCESDTVELGEDEGIHIFRCELRDQGGIGHTAFYVVVDGKSQFCQQSRLSNQYKIVVLRKVLEE